MVQPMGEVFHHDHGGIHQQSHGNGQPAQGHGVQAQPSSFIVQPAFQILVMWLILPPVNCIA